MLFRSQKPKLCGAAPAYFTLDRIKEQISLSTSAQDFGNLRRAIGEVFYNTESLNQSFLYEGLAGLADERQSGVDLDAVSKAFELLSHPELAELTQSSIERSLTSIRSEIRVQKSSFEVPEKLRFIMVFLQVGVQVSWY